MQRLDLSAAMTMAWRDMLPADLQWAVPTDADPAQDALAESIMDELSVVSPRRCADVISRRADDFIAIGGARRQRIICWAIHRGWDNCHIIAMSIIGSNDEGRGEAGRGETGRGKVVPYFRRNFDSLAGVCCARTAYGVLCRETAVTLIQSAQRYEIEFGHGQTGGLS